MKCIPYVPLRNGSRDLVSTKYTTPPYSGGPGCKSVAENRLFWPRYFGYFLITYIQVISNDSQQRGYHRILQADIQL
jgi:hypothetical protein